jgi:DNA-binding beta-propeller fold protein YncE
MRLTMLCRRFSAPELACLATITAHLLWAAGITAAAEPAFAGPVAVAVSADGRWLVTANADDGTVSLIDRKRGSQIDRAWVGRGPRDIVATGSNDFLCVTSAGDLVRLVIVDRTLQQRGRLAIGHEPRGVIVDRQRQRAWVSQSQNKSLAVVDLEQFTITAILPCGGLPRAVAISPTAHQIAVTCSSPPEVLLYDAESLALLERQQFQGLNVGSPCFASPGELFFPFTYDGGSHPSRGNIQRGWVLGSRLGRLSSLDVSQPPPARELAGLTLDVPGQAVGDPTAVGYDTMGNTLFITAGGSHELLSVRRPGLPFGAISGTDLMNDRLARDNQRFRRLILGGRPQGLCLLADQRLCYVANQFNDTIQEIDLDRFTVVREITVAPAFAATSEQQLVRRGEMIFYDASRSLDQWYSCHTCHFEGGGNSVTVDTLNDGSVGTYKTVLPLFGVTETGPWTWHGWQQDLRASLVKSFTDTMQGPRPADEDVDALLAFLKTLDYPPAIASAETSGGEESIQRGQLLFASDRTACTNCHDGPGYSGKSIHNVGLGMPGDAYEGFNPPALRGVSRKTRWLHNGRARSLEELLSRHHGPEKVSGMPPLTKEELHDLLAFLKSI